jgi:hypothetical protein
MSWIELVFSALGGAAVALAAAAWLSRQLLKQLPAKELEVHKAQLAQKSEVLKAELSIYAHEQNVGLTRIDTQRSEAILSIWRLLVQWQEEYLKIAPPNDHL